MNKGINVLIYRNAVSALLFIAQFCHVHFYRAFFILLYMTNLWWKSFAIYTQGLINSYVRKSFIVIKNFSFKIITNYIWYRLTINVLKIAVTVALACCS